MPAVTMHSKQVVFVSVYPVDGDGNPTTDLGSYSLSWSADNPQVLVLAPGPGTQAGYDYDSLTCAVGAASPAVAGTANVIATLTSSDPANDPALTSTATVTITIDHSAEAMTLDFSAGPLDGTIPVAAPRARVAPKAHP